MPNSKEPYASSDARRRERKDVVVEIHVSDVVLGTAFGRLVNISEDGFMIIGRADVRVDHLYQLALNSETSDLPTSQDIHISVGAECLWLKETDSGSQHWAGFRFIDVSDDDREKLKALY